MHRRKQYLDLPSLEEARARVEAAFAALSPRPETIPTAEAAGRVTFGPVFARLSSPVASSSAMDGIAVLAASTAHASETNRLALRPGRDFDVVDTGDPLPPGRDAVIMIEETVRLPDGAMEIAAAVPAWHHVRPAGEDIAAGELVLPARHLIRPADLGALLQAGIDRLEVVARPRALFIPTGSELVPPGTTPARGQIVESNGAVAAALLAAWGAACDVHPIVPDERPLLERALDEALEAGGAAPCTPAGVADPSPRAPFPPAFSPAVAGENAGGKVVGRSGGSVTLQRGSEGAAPPAPYDLILIGAGSSAGRDDHTPDLIASRGELLVRGVATRPAKPVIVGRCAGRCVIGVPGYPVSSVFALETFAKPLVRRLAGLPPESPQRVRAVLTRRLPSSLKYEERVRCRVGAVGGRLIAAPQNRGAGVTMSLVRSNGAFTIPRASEGLERGSEVEVDLDVDPETLARQAVAIGSHDPALDLLAGRLALAPGGFTLASTHAGSLGGLLALAAGECHLAPTHLLDPATGEYNRAAVARYLPGRRILLVKFLRRMQGLLVAPGNPRGIRGLADLTRARFVNRQRGSGTRILLDFELGRLGIDPEAIHGYGREALNHLAVAEAVRAGEADCGLAVLSAARAAGLEFIPVREEEYDLALAPEALDHPAVAALLAAAADPEFVRELEALGGYRPGTLERIELPDE